MCPIVAKIEVTFTPFFHIVEPDWSMFNLCSGTPSQTQEHQNSEEKTQLGNPQALLKDDLLLRTDLIAVIKRDGQKITSSDRVSIRERRSWYSISS